MPSTSSFKASTETIPTLINDAQEYINQTFSNGDSEKDCAQALIIAAAKAYRSRCIEAVALTNLRNKMQLTQNHIESEIPKCQEKVSQITASTKLTQVSLNVHVSKTPSSMFQKENLPEEDKKAKEDKSKKAEKKETKGKSIFAASAGSSKAPMPDNKSSKIEKRK